MNTIFSWEISPELLKRITEWHQLFVQRDVHRLLELERNEDFIAYNQLLKILQGNWDIDWLSQERSPLYDKIFYTAQRITQANQGTPMTLHIWSNSFVRLNDKIWPDSIVTVPEMRKGLTSEVLFSGVGAIQIWTKNGIRVPLLRRDSGAPTDPWKYTLPAGRADKTPWLTAYEEVLEEIVIFAENKAGLQLVVPYLSSGWISEEKAKKLVSIARGNYINALLKTGNISLQNINNILAAKPIVVPMSVTEWGENIRTVFQDERGNITHEVEEGWLFPIHDLSVNTYEMVRWFSLDLTSFDEVFVWDGDGFWREASLFEISEINNVDFLEHAVASLRGALKLGVFK